MRFLGKLIVYPIYAMIIAIYFIVIIIVALTVRLSFSR